MTDANEPHVPEGAAVFPVIPPELGVHPLLLAVLHATVFLAGSDEAVVHPEAAAEAMDHLGTYLQRLAGPDLDRVRTDVAVLVAYARKEKWPKAEVGFLKAFLSDYGIEERQD